MTDWDWEDLLEELDEDNDGQLSAKVRRNNAFLFSSVCISPYRSGRPLFRKEVVVDLFSKSETIDQDRLRTKQQTGLPDYSA